MKQTRKCGFCLVWYWYFKLLGKGLPLCCQWPPCDHYGVEPQKGTLCSEEQILHRSANQINPFHRSLCAGGNFQVLWNWPQELFRRGVLGPESSRNSTICCNTGIQTKQSSLCHEHRLWVWGKRIRLSFHKVSIVKVIVIITYWLLNSLYNKICVLNFNIYENPLSFPRIILFVDSFGQETRPPLMFEKLPVEHRMLGSILVTTFCDRYQV